MLFSRGYNSVKMLTTRNSTVAFHELERYIQEIINTDIYTQAITDNS
jgi:hypothetical protein